MYFNWSLFRRVTYVSLFRSRGTHLRLTAKRIRVLLAFYPLFTFMQLFTRFCWFLDTLFFGSTRGRGRLRTESPSPARNSSPERPVQSYGANGNVPDPDGRRRPLFILGNFRSGTTFLFRALARDTANFTAMKTWEIYLAPTISQRRLYRGVLMVDRLIGSPLRRALERYDRRALGAVRFHKVGLWEPEEDEGLLLYPWAGLFVWFFFPYRHAVRHFIRYDEAMPARRARRIERFYRACIEKHLQSHRESLHYLAKNPAFCGKVQALLRLYPNARFVYLERDPVAQFRSQMSWLSFAWHYFSDPLEQYPFERFALNMAAHWRQHATETLAKLPEDRVCFVKFDDLVSSPKATIRDIYRRLGYPLNREFEAVLDAEQDRARDHRRNRTAKLRNLSVSEAEIRETLPSLGNESERRLRNACLY
jgi:hypothetical protein